MVRRKAAISTLPLVCDGLSPPASDTVLRVSLDALRDFLRRGFHLHRCGAETGCNEALWNADEGAGDVHHDVPPATAGPALRFCGEPRVTVRAEAVDGLIRQGSTWCVDHGGLYRFTLNVRDTGGAAVGLPLVPRESQVGGVVYRCEGPSDGNGDIHVSADTRHACLGQSHALVVALPGIETCINLKVYEFVEVRLVGYAQVQERVRAEIELYRRNAQMFSDLGNWRGYVRLADGVAAPFLCGHSPDVVAVGTGWLPATGAGTLQVRLGFPSSLERLLTGAVDFPIPNLGMTD
ncbi:hypothetical protein V0R50_15830 [Pseudomonas sp. 148P]|uniref:Uncharacterized protein n=1 Tax=Pseudomonas ulcerans TaxID=3115852 RepID=A0ABU7HT23_9PSED|nr:MULTISPECIES: hypothetical protein [unclassified Pseudomonas]MEE1924926.1 hypothetical protein [Pseudomonas sp. 147P]MEE1934699.1 hypothetical protein [Pseudomonas sp. 148P]